MCAPHRQVWTLSAPNPQLLCVAAWAELFAGGLANDHWLCRLCRGWDITKIYKGQLLLHNVSCDLWCTPACQLGPRFWPTKSTLVGYMWYTYTYSTLSIPSYTVACSEMSSPWRELVLVAHFKAPPVQAVQHNVLVRLRASRWAGHTVGSEFVWTNGEPRLQTFRFPGWARLL